jgi:histidine triad (HIT) family protein
VNTAASHDAHACSFCAIAKGQDRSVTVVCEGESWIAFFPHEPATPGHTLVIPRTHVTDLWDLESPLSCELMTAVIRVGKAVNVAVNPEGMNVITSSGASAEQTVFHLHVHVVPRWASDGFGRIWPPGSPYRDSRLADVADRIREACADVDQPAASTPE